MSKVSEAGIARLEWYLQMSDMLRLVPSYANVSQRLERIAFNSFEQLPDLEYLDFLIVELTNESGRSRKDGDFLDAAEKQLQAGKFADYALSLATTVDNDRLLKRNLIYDRYIRLLFELERFEKADRVYQEVFGDDSSNLLAPGESPTLKIRVLSSADRPEEAIGYLEALVEENALAEHVALAMRCKINLDRGETSKAAEDCEASLKIRSSGEARFYYAQNFESQNQLRSAIDQYRLATRSGLDSLDYEFAKRRLEKLENKYFKTVQIDPNVDLVISEKICGDLFIKLSSSIGGSLSLFCENYGTLTQDGKIPPANLFFNLANVAANGGEEDLALAVAEEGIRFDFSRGLTALQIYLLVELGRADEGYKVYDKYFDASGEWEATSLLNRVVDRFEESEKFKAGIGILDYALISSSKELTGGWKGRILRRRAELLQLDGQWQRAIKDHEVVVDQFGGGQFNYYALCHLNLKVRNYPDALEQCEVVLTEVEGKGASEIWALNLAAQAALANDAADLVDSYFNRCLAIQRPDASESKGPRVIYSWGPFMSRGFPDCENPYGQDSAN